MIEGGLTMKLAAPNKFAVGLLALGLLAAMPASAYRGHGGDGWGWGLGLGLVTGAVIGSELAAPYYYYGPPYGVVPAPAYYYPPTVVMAQPPAAVAPQGTMMVAPAPAGGGFWFYCDSARSYYPYVQQCPEPWKKVPAMPPGPVAP
jgi:hypothetical protein